MKNIDYPTLDQGMLDTLDVIRQCLEHDPHYLEDAEGYFPDWFITWLGAGAEDAPEDRSDEEVDLVLETTALFQELRDAKGNFAVDDHSERMSYFRTSTSLLEKLVGLKERSLNVRQISRFYGVVLQVMEEVLEPTQVTEVRERLKEYLP